jgi:hypothetical protein
LNSALKGSWLSDLRLADGPVLSHLALPKNPVDEALFALHTKPYSYVNSPFWQTQ